jgi:hypothetical protein
LAVRAVPTAPKAGGSHWSGQRARGVPTIPLICERHNPKYFCFEFENGLEAVNILLHKPRIVFELLTGVVGAGLINQKNCRENVIIWSVVRGGEQVSSF